MCYCNRQNALTPCQTVGRAPRRDTWGRGARARSRSRGRARSMQRGSGGRTPSRRARRAPRTASVSPSWQILHTSSSSSSPSTTPVEDAAPPVTSPPAVRGAPSARASRWQCRGSGCRGSARRSQGSSACDRRAAHSARRLGAVGAAAAILVAEQVARPHDELREQGRQRRCDLTAPAHADRAGGGRCRRRRRLLPLQRSHPGEEARELRLDLNQG